MKKVFAILALVAAMFVAGNAQAQTTVNIGYSPETFKTTYSSNSIKDNYQGLHFGFVTNVKLVQELGIGAGAQVRMNMQQKKESLLGSTTTIKDFQLLIDVPVLINYNININNNFAITPFVGPMVSFAAIGKTNTKVMAGNTQISDTDHNWYGENGDFKRFNLYAVFGGNVRFGGFNLYGGYRMGLLNILKSTDSVTMKTNGFFVGLGFTL
jgi:hypothetical protein